MSLNRVEDFFVADVGEHQNRRSTAGADVAGGSIAVRLPQKAALGGLI